MLRSFFAASCLSRPTGHQYALSPVNFAITSAMTSLRGVRSARLLRSIPRALPPMLRASYGRELLSWWFLPFMLGAIEAGAMGNIVRKAYDGVAGVSVTELNFAVAAVVAAPSLANIISFAWASLAWGKDKIRFIVGLQVATAICVCLVGMAPENRFGLYWIVAWVILSLRLLDRRDYAANDSVGEQLPTGRPHQDRRPPGHRAERHVRGRGCRDRAGDGLQRGELSLAVPAERDGRTDRRDDLPPRALRGQRRLARSEKSGTGEHGLSMNPLSIFRVLAGDPRYARFQISMFIFGLGNLMLTAPLAIVLHEKFHVGYALGILITTTIPAVLVPTLIPMWGRLLARTHVIQFRSIHAWSYVSASLMFLLAAVTGFLPLMFIASALTGLGNAGGVLAWNLGHQDFAPPGRDSQYMGVHVTLTGIRGLMAPFLAVGIYQLLDSGSPARASGCSSSAWCSTWSERWVSGEWRLTCGRNETAISASSAATTCAVLGLPTLRSARNAVSLSDQFWHERFWPNRMRTPCESAIILLDSPPDRGRLPHCGWGLAAWRHCHDNSKNVDLGAVAFGWRFVAGSIRQRGHHFRRIHQQFHQHHAMAKMGLRRRQRRRNQRPAAINRQRGDQQRQFRVPRNQALGR